MKKQNDKNKDSHESCKMNISSTEKMLERIRIAVANGLIDKKVYDKTEKKIARDLIDTYVVKERVDFLKTQKSDRDAIKIGKNLIEDVKEMLKKSPKISVLSKNKIVERKRQYLTKKDRKILSDIHVLRDIYLRDIISQKEYFTALESIKKEHEKINKQLYDLLREEDLENLRKKITSIIRRHLKKSILKKETEELAKELSNMEVLFENKIISQELYADKCCLIRKKINIYNDLISRIDALFNIYSTVLNSDKKYGFGQKNRQKEKNTENIEEEKKRVILKIKELTAD